MALSKDSIAIRAVIKKETNIQLKELANQLGYSSVSKYIKDLIIKDMKNHNIVVNE